MDINEYRVFLNVSKTLNLTHTARQLNYTQSGISQIVTRLEKKFGFPLLRRNAHGVTITEDGKSMLSTMCQLVNCEDILIKKAQSIKKLVSGKICIGTFSSAAMHWIPAFIRDFRLIYPNIQFELKIDTYKPIIDMLEAELIDCVFITGTTPDKFNFIPLKKDRLLALLPFDHKFAKYDVLPVQAIAELDFIVPGEGIDYDIGQIFKRAGIQPKICYEVSDDYTAIELVNKGLGMTIMPELVLYGINKLPKVLELQPAYSRDIGLATKKNVCISPSCEAFIEFVKSNFNKERQNG